MKRREFIAATAALLVSTPRVRAQGPPRRIGFLIPYFGQPARDAWRSGLRERGWIEGKNLLVEYRYFIETPDRVSALVPTFLGS
jgi:putative ABC transport system substrate-binding protein